MLTVEGRRVTPITAAALFAAATEYPRTVLDIGTGDGRFVLAAAAARRDAYVVGVDANAAGMAESSRRAARAAHRGGLPNARFVVAPAESLAAELPRFADEVHVHFPWGSLLRGLAAPEPAALRMLTGVARAGASVTILLSVAESDAAMGLEPLDEAAVERMLHAYAEHGLTLLEARRADERDLVAAHTSWGKRLSAASRRMAWLLRFTTR